MTMIDLDAVIAAIENERLANAATEYGEGYDEAINDAIAAIRALPASNAEVITNALLSVVEATRAYLPPDGIDAQECISRILAATDNPKINPIILEAENGLPSLS